MRLRLAAAAVVTLFAVATPAGAQTTPPDSMASTGDSITRAFNTELLPFTDAPRNSWSTGSRTSGANGRILALNWRILGRNINDVRSGAKMRDLAGQMTLVNLQHIDYVTVLMGANGARASSESAMTPAPDFRTQFQQALATLTAGSPQTLEYVVRIPTCTGSGSSFTAIPALAWPGDSPVSASRCSPTPPRRHPRTKRVGSGFTSASLLTTMSSQMCARSTRRAASTGTACSTTRSSRAMSPLAITSTRPSRASVSSPR